MASLSLQQVKKSYGPTEVIHGVDLDTRAGEFVVLVGPSGCGKSTLLRIIAGLETASDGDVIIDGERVNHVPASDRGLAMVFQSYALYPHMSVYQNMAFGLENAKLPRAEIDQRVRRASDMLRISDFLTRKPKALSGGQRQRVAIGRAIVRDPKIFLFDEPLSNLDAELRVAMRKELAALHASLGGSMIYVTHDQTEAMTLADRIVVLNAGRIEQIGTPLDLYNRPRNTFVAGFIGSPRMNLIDAEVISVTTSDLVLRCGGQSLPLPLPATGKVSVQTGDRVSLGIRPEHFSIASDDKRSAVAVSVDLSEQLGGETYLYCSAADLPQLTVHQIGQVPVGRGETLKLSVDVARAHLFDAEGHAVSGEQA